jgi:hypothetical protein
MYNNVNIPTTFEIIITSKKSKTITKTLIMVETMTLKIVTLK